MGRLTTDLQFLDLGQLVKFDTALRDYTRIPPTQLKRLRKIPLDKIKAHYLERRSYARSLLFVFKLIDLETLGSPDRIRELDKVLQGLIFHEGFQLYENG